MKLSGLLIMISTIIGVWIIILIISSPSLFTGLIAVFSTTPIIIFCAWNYAPWNCKIPAGDFDHFLTKDFIQETEIDITNYPII